MNLLYPRRVPRSRSAHVDRPGRRDGACRHRGPRDGPHPALQAQRRGFGVVDRHRLAVAVPRRAALRHHGHQPGQAPRPAPAPPAPADGHRRGDAGRRRGQGSADPARIRDRPADRPAQRARQQDRGPAQRRPGLSAHAGGDRGGQEERRPGELHLPRRQGGRGLPPGADPGAAPRRRGAGADRRRRRRLFLFAAPTTISAAPASPSRASCIRISPGACRS